MTPFINAPHPLLTASQFEMCAAILNVVHIGMLFQLDLTPFVTVMSSFNFRRPDIWLMTLLSCSLYHRTAGLKQITLPVLHHKKPAFFTCIIIYDLVVMFHQTVYNKTLQIYLLFIFLFLPVLCTLPHFDCFCQINLCRIQVS